MLGLKRAPNLHAGCCSPEVQLPHVRSGPIPGKAAIQRGVTGKLPWFCASVFTSLPVFATVQLSGVLNADKRQTPAPEDGHSTVEVQESVGKVGSSTTM